MRAPSLLLAALLWSFGILASGQAPDETDPRLNSLVQGYAVSGANLLQALAKASDDLHVRMGIEWEIPAKVGLPISLRFAEATALQIIQGIVLTDPSYNVLVTNGVVHVARKATTEDPRNFLNLRLSEFELSSEYVGHANNRLHQIVTQMTRNPKPGSQAKYGCAGSFGVGSGDFVASFRLESPSIRDVLDRLIAAAGFNLWLVSFPSEPKTTPAGFFETISIFSRDLPDSQLPTWDFLVPGYDPVREGFGPGWPQDGWQPVEAERKHHPEPSPAPE